MLIFLHQNKGIFPKRRKAQFVRPLTKKFSEGNKPIELFMLMRGLFINKINVIGKKRPFNKEQMRNKVEDFMSKRKNNRKQVQK